MNKAFSILLCFFLIINLGLSQAVVKKEKRKQKLEKSFLREDRPWTIDLPIWIPGFRGDFVYGDVSLEGEDGQNPGIPTHPIEPPPPTEPPWGGGNIFSRLFTSSTYLKFYFVGRVAYERNNFLVQADMFSGAVGNDLNFRFNDKLVAQANVSISLGRVFMGYSFVRKESNSKKFRYELYPYIGVRVHFISVTSDLDKLVTRLDIHPIWTEPIFGVINQFTLQRWLFIVQADYGGYLVDSKGSYMINLLSYYKMSNVVSLKLGWTDWEITHKDRFKNNDLSVKVQLSGPTVGVNFHF